MAYTFKDSPYAGTQVSVYATTQTNAVVNSAVEPNRYWPHDTMPDHDLTHDRETLHRLAAIISGGFDTLPHCGCIEFRCQAAPL